MGVKVNDGEVLLPDVAVVARDAGSPEKNLLLARWRRGVAYGTQDAASRRVEHLTYVIVKQGGGLLGLAWVALQPTGWIEWSGFALFYVLNILGMSLGYHRYFTHRSFETSRPMRYALGALAQFGMYGSLRRWCADHRRHHAFSDRPGDPHSPHIGNRGQPIAGVEGLRHAHLGWLYDDCVTSLEIYGKGVVGDPAIEWAHRTRWFWMAVSLVGLPALWGYALGGAAAVPGAILVAGFLRAALATHAIAAVYSFGHIYGYRNFEVGDTSRNNLLLGYLTLGEGWHNNHHAHGRAASNRVRFWEVDMTAWLIRAMEMTGLVWNVRWK